MLGAFYCPHCKEPNACDCPTCEPYIKDGEYVCRWTEDKNGFICSKCNLPFSPDQALDTEYEVFALKSSLNPIPPTVDNLKQ